MMICRRKITNKKERTKTMKTMKKRYGGMVLAVGLFWSAASVAQAGGDFITQIPVIDGEQQPGYHMELHADNGEMISPHVMEGGEGDSALFQLWGAQMDGDSVAYKKLDEGIVGVLMPNVRINVETVETKAGLHNVLRTRVDVPFRVTVDVRNIPHHASENASDDARRVIFYHSGQGYDLQNRRSYSPPAGQEDVWTLFYDTEFTNNLEHVYEPDPRMTMLDTLFPPTVHPAAIMGRERFIATTRPVGNNVAMELAKETIEIWPMASGGLEGIAAHSTIYEIPHNVTASVKNAYPWCEIFYSVWDVNTGDLYRFPDSILLRENVPQDLTMELGAWMRQNITEDGDYVVLVEADTPFDVENLELLVEVPFTYRRTVEVRGNITTSPSADNAP